MTQRLDYEALAGNGMKALAGVYLYVRNSGLPKELLDLAYLRASQINGCAYCVDLHSRDLRKAGVADEKLMLVPVWREAEGWFTERERAALAWTEAVTLVAVDHIPDAAFAVARAAFDEKELADLTIAIGLINTYNRIAIGFRRVPAVPDDAQTT
ncbi:MAG: carboxymuconolactone decarboxylase family protein [Proteobacteria bacterium]|nr:carboxymuconolactone decarboxylase family protein [Pseudomonadota bacterium]